MAVRLAGQDACDGDLAREMTDEVAPHEADLRERLARLEQATGTLQGDVSRVRDRTHDTANEVQKLIGEVMGLNKTVERLITALGIQAATQSALGTELQTHVTGCHEEAMTARADRASFRREVRRYMVGMITTLLLYFLAGKLHIKLDSFGQ